MTSRPNRAIAERIVPLKARPRPSARRVVRRTPALFSPSRVADTRREPAPPGFSRKIGDQVTPYGPKFRTVSIISALVAGFLTVGSLLAAELGSMLIGLVGSCILFLICVPFFTSFGGSSAPRR